MRSSRSKLPLSVLAAAILFTAVAADRPAAGAWPAAEDTQDATTTVTTPKGLSFTVPRSWKSTEGAVPSPMRQAGFQAPKADGDAEDAELVVNYFGQGQGGTVEANLARWYGQFERPDGKPVKDSARTEKKLAGPLEVTLVDVSGTYVAPKKPSTPQDKFNKPGFRMLAAIVPTDVGPFFFKLTGPEKTIELHRKAFVALVESLRFEKK